MLAVDLKILGALAAVDGVRASADSSAAPGSDAIEELFEAKLELRNNRRLQSACVPRVRRRYCGSPGTMRWQFTEARDDVSAPLGGCSKMLRWRARVSKTVAVTSPWMCRILLRPSGVPGSQPLADCVVRRVAHPRKSRARGRMRSISSRRLQIIFGLYPQGIRSAARNTVAGREHTCSQRRIASFRPS